jgi:hypothetical protein
MSADDLERLTNIIQFAHKYLLQNCLRWALESVEHVLEHSAATIHEGQYPLILRAMALCTPVHTEICEHICELLKPQWITHIKADTHRLGHALDIAETFHIESFLVDLYLIALDRLAACEPARALTVEGPLYGIGAIHQLRVLAGYWYLSRSFGNFLSVPPTNIHSGVCTPQCDRIVASLWKTTCRNHAGDTNVHSPSDVFEKLAKFKEDFVARVHAMSMYMAPCPIETEMDASLAAFKTSFTSQFFALPHGPQ